MNRAEAVFVAMNPACTACGHHVNLHRHVLSSEHYKENKWACTAGSCKCKHLAKSMRGAEYEDEDTQWGLKEAGTPRRVWIT